MSGWWRRNAVLVVLAVAAACLVVWYVQSWRVSAGSLRERAVARARLSACLSNTPVEHRSPGTLLLRAIQLQPTGDWPKRCVHYASDLEQLLATPDHPASNAASRALEQGKLFEFYSVQNDLASLLTAPEDEPIVPVGEQTRDVPPPPAPSMLPRALVPVASRLDPSVGLGEHELALIVGDQIRCRFEARDGGLEPTAHCSYPADALAFEGFERRYLTNARDVAVVIGGHVRTFATGETISGSGSSSVVLASEYAGTVFGWDPAHAAVVRRDPTGTVSTLRLPHPVEGRAALVGDQLVWAEGKHVVAAQVAGAKLGPITQVTALAVHPLWSAVCSTSELTAVLLAEAEAEQYRIAVHADGVWTVSDPGPYYTLSCTGNVVTGVATSSASDKRIKIDRVDCTRGRCTSGSATISGASKLFAAAAIGDATIVVWIDTAVHAVSGPLAQLATLPSFPIYDGFEFEQLHDRQTSEEELLQGIEVVGRGASAIVLLSGEGVKLVHVRDRKAERVSVVFE